MTPVHLRNVPPPDEKFEHTRFFDFLFSYIRPEVYLELGVRCGTNFNAVSKHCKLAIGVDVLPLPFTLGHNQVYYQQTTDSFFKAIGPSMKFDCVFIDADHSHEQSYKDFLNVKDRVIEDGFIFLHDTYPITDFYICDDGCSDCYKTALKIKSNFIDEFEVLTLPFQPGLSMLKRMNRNKQMAWKDPESLSRIFPF